MDDTFDASRYVVRARRNADLSQRELAERLGLSRAAVGRLESAAGRIAVNTLVRVLGIAGLRLARERRRVLRLLRASASPVPACTCPTRCLVGAACVSTCPCQCEPGPRTGAR